MLCAAWVTDDENLSELAQRLRLQASTHVDRIPDPERYRTMRLLDVLRRASAWESANKLILVLKGEDLSKFELRVVDYQEWLISRRDASCYTFRSVKHPPSLFWKRHEPTKREEIPMPAFLQPKPEPTLLAGMRRWIGW